jgi:hypothetical protein
MLVKRYESKIQILFYTIVLTVSVNAAAESLPKNIANQIPPGYAVLSFKSGELNEDKRIDFIVVLRKRNEESISRETGTPSRPLLLFIQNTDGSYTPTKRNDHVVFKIDEGGQCDPFENGQEGLAITKHYFTVQNSVACGQHWSDYITFRHAPELHDWVFHKRISESWVMNNSTDPNAEALIPGGRTVVTGKGKPPILFDKYQAN